MTAAIVLPGLDGDGRLRRAFAELLRPKLDPLLLSYPASESLGYAALERVVRDQLPTNEAFVLIAESFSGPIACRLAASQPTGLKALILVASFACSPVPVLYPFRGLSRFAPIHAVPGAVLSWWLFGRWGNAALVAELSSAIARVSPAALRERVSEVLAVNAFPALRSIKVPVLGLRGSSDRLIGARPHAKFKAAIGQFTEAVVEGPHALMQAAPKACAERTIEFCQAQGILDKDG